MRDIDEVRTICERQHGLVTVAQLNALAGIDRRVTLRRQLALVSVSPTLLRLHGSPLSDAQAILASVLDVGPGAVLSHDSASALWGIPGFLVQPVHATGVRALVGRDSAFLATVHRPRSLLPGHTTTLDGFPVTTPARTVFDLATLGHHPKRVERALDAAWAKGLVDQRTMDSLVRVLAKRGRRGSTLMRALVDDRRENYRPPESGLEFRFRELMQSIGLEFELQVEVGDGESWLGRLDFRHRSHAYLVQIDSERYHSALIDRRRDEEQNARLHAAGWALRRFSDVDVWHRASMVKNAVRTDLSVLRELGGTWGPEAPHVPPSSVRQDV